jgi:ParB-like chromosome segregation protein Spo0J
MARLVEFGMSAPKLAKRIGRSASYVRERLKLLELPPPARRLVDDGTLGIEPGPAQRGLRRPKTGASGAATTTTRWTDPGSADT